MPASCVHFHLRDFVRAGEAYHYARTDLVADNAARYHDHDYHEIFWVVRGEGEHRLNGKTHPLSPGAFHLVRPEDRHRVNGSDAAPLRLVNIAFPGRSWHEIRKRYFADEADWFELPEARRSWTVDARAQMLLNHWSERLAAVSRPRLSLDGFLMDLPQLRPAVAATVGRAPVPDWLVRALRELSKPEVFAGGTLEWCRRAGRTPAHVARATVRWLGQTPTELLNQARMDYSARQLAETSRPILDIMLDCGLNNLSHFYALFRKRFGLSPRRYRLQAHPTVRG